MSKMREAAEQAYTISAFDYPSNPVGSRDWCLYWAGYQAAIAAVKEGGAILKVGAVQGQTVYAFPLTDVIPSAGTKLCVLPEDM